jgi:hypothetical protein
MGLWGGEGVSQKDRGFSRRREGSIKDWGFRGGERVSQKDRGFSRRREGSRKNLWFPTRGVSHEDNEFPRRIVHGFYKGLVVSEEARGFQRRTETFQGWERGSGKDWWFPRGGEKFPRSLKGYMQKKFKFPKRMGASFQTKTVGSEKERGVSKKDRGGDIDPENDLGFSRRWGGFRKGQKSFKNEGGFQKGLRVSEDSMGFQKGLRVSEESRRFQRRTEGFWES